MRGLRRLGALFALWAAGGGVMAAEAALGAEEGAAPTVAAPAAPTGSSSLEYGGSLEPRRIIVTATRLDTPLEETTGAASVLAAGRPGGSAPLLGQGANLLGDAELRQYRKLSDALRSAPGLSYNDDGGLTSVFIRGMRSEHTKLMLDGMPVNDPSSLQNSINFSGLSFDNLSQMEVLRGPQSVLHGSGALGGVINLTSRKGEGPLSGFVSSEGGSFGTFITRLGVSAGTNQADFSLGGSFRRTDGVSSAARQYGNREKDGFGLGNIALRLGANPTDCLRLDLFANAMKSKADLDSGGGPDFDNPYYTVDNERYMLRPQATLTLFDGRWEQIAGIGYMQQTRKYKDEPYNGLMVDKSRWRGETWKFDYQNVIRLVEWNAILAGVDVVRESMESQYEWYGSNITPVIKSKSITTTGLFLEDQVNIGDTFSANIGLRHEHHGKFGNHVAWKSGLSYKLPTETKLLASIGTGFRAPSLYELYGSAYGTGTANPNLKPEKGLGWDLGFEQSLFCDRVNFGASYFQNRTKDMIISGPNWGPYVNASGKTKTWGVEAFASYKITDSLALSGQYTWTRVRNEENPGDLDVQSRRPLNAFNINLDWTFCDKGTFTAGLRHVGGRWDSLWSRAYTQSYRRMPSYTIARVGASWKATKHIEVFGRVENLFNQKYEEVYGYGTMGIGFFAGATVSF